MPLAREDGRQPVSPDLFHRRQDAQLVVDHDVVARRVAPLRRRPASVPCGCRSARGRRPRPTAPSAATLRGWKTTSPSDRMTVGPQVPKMREGVERARVQPARRTDSPPGTTTSAAAAGRSSRSEPVALQRAEVVRVAQLGAQRFEDRPVAIPARGAELALEMVACRSSCTRSLSSSVLSHVEQEDDVVRGASCVTSGSSTGLCQPPSAAMSASASFGPQLPALVGANRDGGSSGPGRPPPRRPRPRPRG